MVAESNFDEWGRTWNPTDWTYVNAPAPPAWLYRGYTGNEHVEPFALVNMNGRMYDPLNGRMLSPDNYIQGGLGTQGFNRYSYAGNNPLKYTDPDGQNPLLVAALIGGFMNWLSHGAEFSLKGLQYFGVGAASAVITAGVSGGVSSTLADGGFWAGAVGSSGASAVGFGAGALAGAAGGGAGGFLLGLGNSALAGNSTKDILNAGLRDGAYGALSGALVGGIQGGMAANRQGANFWTGKKGQLGRGRLSFTPNRPKQETDNIFEISDKSMHKLYFDYGARRNPSMQDVNRVAHPDGFNDLPSSRTLRDMHSAKGAVQIRIETSFPAGTAVQIENQAGRILYSGTPEFVHSFMTFGPGNLKITAIGGGVSSWIDTQVLIYIP